MRGSRKLVVAVVVATTSAATFVGIQLTATDRDALIAAAPGSVAGGVAPEAGSDAYTLLNPASVENFEAFELFLVGDSFEGLPLTDVLHWQYPLEVYPGEEDEAEGIEFTGMMNYVDFIYGDCDASEGSCLPPLVIQVHPACKRNLTSNTEIEEGLTDSYAPLTIRGVPAAMYDDGQMLEIYTGRVTVVIYGHLPGQMLRAADALQATGADPSATADLSDLDPPAPGALEGALNCTAAEAAES